MKTLLGTYDLKNRLTGRYESASLFEGIDESNLLSFERDWKIAFAERLPADASTAERIAANAQDAHWDWRRLAEIRKRGKSPGERGFSVGLLVRRIEISGRGIPKSAIV